MEPNFLQLAMAGDWYITKMGTRIKAPEGPKQPEEFTIKVTYNDGGYSYGGYY